MTDMTVEAIVTALPPTLVALGGLIVSLRNSRKSDAIHVLVNSNLTEVKSRLAEANEHIHTLQTTIALQGERLDKMSPAITRPDQS